jgi:hypothetical protein
MSGCPQTVLDALTAAGDNLSAESANVLCNYFGANSDVTAAKDRSEDIALGLNSA